MKFPKTLAFLLCMLLAVPLAHAQQRLSDEDADAIYAYEPATMQKFSQLYWALSKFESPADDIIDKYLMINECDIYKDYSHNEFEWKKIRDAGRTFLKENRNQFSLRFEIMQPLRLTEYSIDKHTFELHKDYQIKGVRRFEVYATNNDQKLCTGAAASELKGYPAGLIMELSRPVMLTSISVDPDTAKDYIDEKAKIFKALRSGLQTDQKLYELRDAYLVMKVKFFSYRQETRIGYGPPLAETLGILERIEIYSDKKKKKLMFVEDYRRKRKTKRTQSDIIKDLPAGPLLLDDPAAAGTVQSVQ